MSKVIKKIGLQVALLAWHGFCAFVYIFYVYGF